MTKVTVAGRHFHEQNCSMRIHKNPVLYISSFVLLAAFLAVVLGGRTWAQANSRIEDKLPLIQPEELAKSIQQGRNKALIIQTGFRVLYQQAHIPGSEYIGPTSSPEA